ncbi:3-methyladenine DNA glycosylase [Actinotalea sp.]|uniref:3-methyladenine DNA glycosylase n=1 Tax=Actinotalea sp. TaxID=1872145 RepID=UPI0035672B3E
MPVAAPTVLEPAEWTAAAAEHAARADELTAAHRARRAAGVRHPIEDFLVDYYGLRPGRLRRWHPGVGVRLAGPDAPHDGERWYRSTSDGRGLVELDTPAFLSDRGSTVGYVRHLLSATASRPAHTGCLGLHEWAMVYRQDDPLRRHDLPLRLGREGTDAVVESHPIRCSHIDAFRFFTPQARPLNRLQPTRETQPDLEQPGCLHATMDLLKWAMSLGPAVPGDLLLDTLELAFASRRLDMQASPYDVSSLGERAVAIETAEGRAEYVERQRGLAARAAPLRRRLIEVCDLLLATERAA